MILLILGVLLWAVAHLLKRFAPEFRNRLGAGDKAKGPISIALFASIIMMIFGYRMADGAVFWGRSPATVGINNLLMLASFYLFAASGMKTRIASRMRHPMLTAFVLFCVAHLLVNGDVPSFVLFGGLLIWAVIEIVTINSQDGSWTPPHTLPKASTDVRAIVGAIIVMGVVMVIHNWLGYQPWG